MLLQETGYIKIGDIPKYHKLGLKTVQDILTYYPRTYEDRRAIFALDALTNELPCATFGNVINTNWQTTKSQKRFFEVVIQDQTRCKLALQWYHCTPRMAAYLEKQQHLMVYGVPKFRHYMPIMMNPEFSSKATPEDPGLHFKRIVPIYGLTDKLYQEDIRTAIYKILLHFLHDYVYSYIPQELADRYHLPDFYESVMEVHFPKCADMIRLLNRNTPFHKRLIYEELFIQSLCIEINRIQHAGEHITVTPDHLMYADIIERFYENAGFRPTPSQVNVIGECIKDIDSEIPMRMIVNGDVGTGKTTVALDVATYCKTCGLQTAFMVPTEILAKQHFLNTQKYFEGTGVFVDLLIGAMTPKSRQLTLQRLQDGETDIIIGTHALIQNDVVFNNLGLVIIDEQHKFGAVQRTILSNKNTNVHLLQMSATPIPRTIQLTLYGDMRVLSLARIPGKVPATTRVFPNYERKKLYRFLRSYLQSGDQIYIVYPLVEDSEHVDLTSATTMAEMLSQEFSEYEIGLIHGQLRPKDKDAVMERFVAGEIHILVSTTVIEVGVDVHNATIMVIEHAERFGLSQLHQLRGRVGRGKKESFCVLVTHGRIGDIAKKRIQAMLETSDGFIIAEQDLNIRGPGDYFGVAQSGFVSTFMMADLIRDVRALEYARNDAKALLEKDPDLQGYPLIREKTYDTLTKIYV